MDQQAIKAERGRSPSAGRQPQHHQPSIRNSHSSSARPYPSPESVGLGIGLDNSGNVAHLNPTDYRNFTPSEGFDQFMDASRPSLPQQMLSDSAGSFTSNQDFSPSFPQQSPEFRPGLLGHDFNAGVGGDCSLFPSSNGQGDQFSPPLFGDTSPASQAINPTDLNNMSSPQIHQTPTPPLYLKAEPCQSGSAHQSPSFNGHQFSSPPGRHSRHSSLVPETSLLGAPVDWSLQQFRGHRRSASEYSDVSSVAHSPNLVSHDSFEHALSEHGHSPLQLPQDGVYDGVSAGLGNFSISDPNVTHNSRSPSHSPAMSPHLPPQSMSDVVHDMGQQGAGLALGGHAQGYMSAPSLSYPMSSAEAFPTMASDGGMSMAPPSINIDFAPTKKNSFDSPRQQLDQDALTPPERGRARARPRAVTDPYNSGGSTFSGSANLSHLGDDLAESQSRSKSRSDRSLSPGDRSGSANAASRRRQSMSSVPNNVIALRLADPDYQATQENPGNAKRAQRHPATFQCTLCPKRFTRAYNLRSHLRTHTDERPFVCTVCGKAFARQHDRKRHEGLHSGEKKFVCKGDLKAGGQWGCGRRFARADALGRHFRSEAGRICIKPLLDEEMLERQRLWQAQNAASMAQNMAAHHQVMMDSNHQYPSMDAGGFTLPASLLAQYPALAQMNWNTPDMGNVEDELSGLSSYDPSDYDEAEENNGCISGSRRGFGETQARFGEMGYTSDYGGR